MTLDATPGSAAAPRVLFYSRGTSSLPLYRSLLPAGWELTTIDAADDDDARRAKLAAAEILVHSELRLTADDLATAERLVFIQRTGAGLDGLDVGAAQERGIVVATCDGGTEAVAEHAVMLMLAVGRRLGHMHQQVVGLGWPKWQFRAESIGLWRRTVGIVGFGRIGQAVAERVLAFGGNVLVRRDADRPLESRWPADRVSAVTTHEELFSRSDFVSLHCPLVPQTRGMVNEALIGRMGRQAILINTARGALVDELALAAAIRENRIAGAGLDVLSAEPAPADHPLLGLRNVLVTPHVAAGTGDVGVAKVEFVYANIGRFLGGDPVHLQVTADPAPAAP